jgi:hypothetical protein
MSSKALGVEHIPKMRGKTQLVIGSIILRMLIHCGGAL